MAITWQDPTELSFFIYANTGRQIPEFKVSLGQREFRSRPRHVGNLIVCACVVLAVSF